MFLLLHSCQSHAALMGLSLFSVISVFNMETSPAGDIVTFGSDYSLVRMRREQFLETVPRNNHNMVLLELSKGMLTFNKTQFIFPNIQTPLFRNPLEFETRCASHEKEATTNDTVSLIQGQPTRRWHCVIRRCRLCSRFRAAAAPQTL